MKKLLAIAALLILLWPFCAEASPFLVANPETVTLAAGQTLTYNVSGLPASFTGASNIPAGSTGTYAFALNLAGIATGSYTVTAQACLNDPIWGQTCSAASSPFSFTVPGAPAAPSTISLSTKQ